MDTTYRAKDEARRGVVIAARAGYAAKGAIYTLIGALALMAAFGEGGGTSGSGGILAFIAGQPFGQILLVALGCGLAGYALWRLVQTGIDPEHEHEEGAKNVARRIGYAISGLLHAGLAVMAFQIVAGGGSGGSGASGGGGSTTWAAKVLGWPGGSVLLALAGVAVIGFGLYQLYRAWSVSFRDRLELERMSRDVRTWAIRAGRGGMAARGVVFSVIGYFLIRAGLSASPEQAQGVGAALDYLAAQSYGTVLLTLVAAGLVLYGLFQFVHARYRRLEI